MALAVLPPELRKLDDAIATGAARSSSACARGAGRARRAAAAPPLTLDAGAASGALAEPWRGATARHVRCCTASPAAARPRSTCAPRRAALGAGRQALVLVPEINLTPQLEARFAERFAGPRARRRCTAA